MIMFVFVGRRRGQGSREVVNHGGRGISFRSDDGLNASRRHPGNEASARAGRDDHIDGIQRVRTLALKCMNRLIFWQIEVIHNMRRLARCGVENDKAATHAGMAGDGV